MFGAWAVNAVATVSMFRDSHNVPTRCEFDSPLPGAINADHIFLVEAYATTVPAGRYCLWQTTDGRRIAEQTGWTTTAIALVFVVLAVIAVTALARTPWRVPALLGIAGVMTGWIIMAIASDMFLSPMLSHGEPFSSVTVVRSSGDP